MFNIWQAKKETLDDKIMMHKKLILASLDIVASVSSILTFGPYFNIANAIHAATLLHYNVIISINLSSIYTIISIMFRVKTTA